MATANAEDIRHLYVAAAPLTRVWSIEPDPASPTMARDTAAQLQSLKQGRPDDTFLERTRALWVLVEKWPTNQEVVNVAQQLAHDIRADLSRALLEPETAFTWAPNTALTFQMPARLVEEWEQTARDAVLADAQRRSILQLAAEAATVGVDQRTALVTYISRAGEPAARPEQIAAALRERDSNLERLDRIAGRLGQRAIDAVTDSDDLIDATRISATWDGLDPDIDAAINQIEQAGARASRPISIRQLLREATPRREGLADLTPRINVELARSAIQQGMTGQPDPRRVELEQRVLAATLGNSTSRGPVGTDDLIDLSERSAEDELRDALRHLRRYDQATATAQRRIMAAETFIRRYESILGRDTEPLLAVVRTTDRDQGASRDDPTGDLIDHVQAVAREIRDGWPTRESPQSRADAIRAVDAVADRVAPGFRGTADAPKSRQAVDEAVESPRERRGPSFGR